MRWKADAHEGLSLMAQHGGIPLRIIMDGSNKRTMGVFCKKVKEMGSMSSRLSHTCLGRMWQNWPFVNSRRVLAARWLVPKAQRIGGIICLNWNLVCGPLQLYTTQSMMAKYLNQSCLARQPIYHPLLNLDGMIGSSSMTHLGNTQSQRNYLVDSLAQQSILAM